MNKLQYKLRNNEVSFGTWVQIGNPISAEILASIGFDWICVDLEHGIIDLETMTNIFRAIDSFDCVPIARIPKNDYVWIHRVLDAGAKGIIIPMIKTEDEAAAAISECLYPPIGNRGFGYSRANMYGKKFNKCIEDAGQDNITIILQIEHITAIHNLESILQLMFFDGTIIGPLDLAGSRCSGIDNVSMESLLDKYLVMSTKYYKPSGIHIVRPNYNEIKNAIDKGYKLIGLGLDTVFLEENASSVLKLSKEIESLHGDIKPNEI